MKEGSEEPITGETMVLVLRNAFILRHLMRVVNVTQ